MHKNKATARALGSCPRAGATLRTMLAIAFCAGLSACAATGRGADNQGPGPALAAELYRGKYDFVRIEPSEPGAAANQPRAIDAADLSAALALLKVNHAEPVFLPGELTQIVPHLARALALARPNEDVVFAVAGRRNLLGLLAPNLISTGRLFVSDGKLNLIFGLLQSGFDIDRSGNQPSKVFAPGSRLRPQAQAGKVASGAGFSSLPGRSDWLTLPLERALPPSPVSAPSRALPAVTTAAAAAVVTDPAVSDVERRLAINARLRQQGLVSEAEYQEKRRAILNDF